MYSLCNNNLDLSEKKVSKLSFMQTAGLSFL